jgi:hypothetical protein
MSEFFGTNLIFLKEFYKFYLKMYLYFQQKKCYFAKKLLNNEKKN